MRSTVKRVILASALSLLAAFPVLATASAAAPPAFTANDRYASIVVDAETGRVLAAANADQALHPASLTKIMTLYMTFDALKRGQIGLQQSLRISSHAEAMTPTKLGLRTGQVITTEQAILGLVTKSANDAAVVLAEALGGSEENFARMMTQRARSLGMAQTVFMNASGLPNRAQVSSARDMALLAMALLRDHPRHYRYFSTTEFSFRGQVHPNHNRLLGGYAGADGIKTGFVNASGFNLVASAQRDGRRVIGVVFGGNTGRARDLHMISLLDDGFRSLGTNAPTFRAAEDPLLLRVTEQKRRMPSAASSAPVPSPAPTLSKVTVRKGATADEIERAAIAASGGRGWMVQVGVFKTQPQAERALATSLRLAPKETSMASSDVATVKMSIGTRYRARLQNLTGVQAKTLCDQLKRQKQPCQPIAPAPGVKAVQAGGGSANRSY